MISLLFPLSTLDQSHSTVIQTIQVYIYIYIYIYYIHNIYIKIWSIFVKGNTSFGKTNIEQANVRSGRIKIFQNKS